jgi:outer membrane protein assembly factor BamA
MKSLYIVAGLLFAVSVASGQEAFMVHSISFSGNNSFSESDLRNVMLTKESPASFYSFFYRVFRIGKGPEFFDPFVFRADLQRIKQFYKNNGFFYAGVDTSIDYDVENDKVDINIEIKEGLPSYVDSISYYGIDDSSSEFVQMLNDRPLLTNGVRYSVDRVNGEVARIVNILQNDGYPYAKRDSSPVINIKPLKKNSDSGHVNIDLYFSSGRKCFWGDVSVQPLDTGNVSYEKRVVLRELLFSTGEPYSISKKTDSEQRIDALNLFEPARITIPSKPPPSDTLPGTLFLRSRPGHEVTLGPLVSDENNAFNFGGELDYLQRNFLGDARLFTLTTSFQLQSIGLLTFSSKALSDTVTVGRIDVSAQLTQPYFLSNTTSLTEGVSFLVDKQKPYVQLVVRNKVRISERLAEYTTGYLDWDIERAKVDSLQAIALPPGLETPQFNSILSFTLQRDKTDAVYNPTKGFFNLMTIEEGGVLPYFIHSVFPHLDFPYARYWKFTLLGKWFFSTNSDATNILAFKSKVGYAQEYGTYAQDHAGPIPLNYRFFAGGSGSVRGWRTRELGDVRLPEGPTYGGNALLELNLEDRYQIIGDFGGVVFVDAGNLWNAYRDITFRSIAGAVGFGLRYNTFFGPLRVDFGDRLYDPSAPSGQKFIFQLLRNRLGRAKLLSELVVHFGIGQAF